MRLVPVFPAALLCAFVAQAAVPHRTVWNLGEYTWIRLEASEKGAEPSEQPMNLDPEALRSHLAAIRYQDETLFETHELDGLLKALVEAFSVASPGEDVILLSNSRRGGSFMNPASAVTARLFIRGGKVNVIVNDARYAFIDRVRSYTMNPTFVYGSRTRVGDVVLGGQGVTNRADWVAFPAVPYTAHAPVTAADALASMAAKARPTDQENRLKALQRLKDENLITEEEYQKKRKEILDSL